MALATLVHRPSTRRPTVRHFDRWLDDLWGGFGAAPLSLAESAFLPTRSKLARVGRSYPQLDAQEFEAEYRVTAELPGVDGADLEVTVDGGVLCIKGRRCDPQAETDAEPSAEADDRFERRLRFPVAIAEDEVTASCKNGMLRVTVPKLVEPEPEVRTIPVEVA
jgi:HSP20 family protein